MVHEAERQQPDPLQNRWHEADWKLNYSGFPGCKQNMKPKSLKHKGTGHLSGEVSGGNGNLHKLLYQNTYDEVLSVRDAVFGDRVLKEGKVKGGHRLGH